MRWLRRIPVMLVMWLTMGGLVTAGFFSLRYEDHQRCEAGNEFRREALPMAFDQYTVRLGIELDAPSDRVANARADVAADLDELFPERDCSLL
ncbi:MAG: hypothetical protein ACRDZV_16220 [Acidimicrobiia bacterium]